MCNKIYFLLVTFLLKLANSKTIVPEYLDENRPIVTSDCDPKSSTVVRDVTMGPCYDYGNCRMPDCCGITSGIVGNISVTYIASVAMNKATTHGLLVGVALGPSNNKLVVEIPTTQIPNAVLSYDYNSCRYTHCPQEAGKVYRFDGIFTFPTTAITTAGLFADVVLQLTSNVPGNPVVLCRRLFVQLLNGNLVPSVTDIFKNPLLGFGK